jgi:hypothetical protein
MSKEDPFQDLIQVDILPYVREQKIHKLQLLHTVLKGSNWDTKLQDACKYVEQYLRSTIVSNSSHNNGWGMSYEQYPDSMYLLRSEIKLTESGGEIHFRIKFYLPLLSNNGNTRKIDGFQPCPDIIPNVSSTMNLVQHQIHNTSYPLHICNFMIDSYQNQLNLLIARKNTALKSQQEFIENQINQVKLQLLNLQSQQLESSMKNSYRSSSYETQSNLQLPVISLHEIELELHVKLAMVENKWSGGDQKDLQKLTDSCGGRHQIWRCFHPSGSQKCNTYLYPYGSKVMELSSYSSETPVILLQQLGYYGNSCESSPDLHTHYMELKRDEINSDSMDKIWEEKIYPQFKNQINQHLKTYYMVLQAPSKVIATSEKPVDSSTEPATVKELNVEVADSSSAATSSSSVAK